MPSNWIRALGLAAALLIVQSAMILIDQQFVLRSPFADGPPVYSTYYAIRLVAAVILATMGAILVFRWNPDILDPRGVLPAPLFSFAFAVFCVAGTVGVTLVLFLDPGTFFGLAREDSFFEWSSALLLLAASAMMLVSGFRLLSRSRRGAGVIALVLGVLLFLTGMEEISWMQRLIGFGTPEALKARNFQVEANCHNMATTLFENLYYGGAFVLLVFVPSLAFLFRASGPLSALRELFPSRYAMLVGALSAGFSYEMWNVFWIQFAYFYCVLLLGGLAGEALRIRRWRDGLLFGCAVVALVACHLVVLGVGPTMVRPWDDTEFKELIIALGLFLHAAEVGLRVRNARQVEQIAARA